MLTKFFVGLQIFIVTLFLASILWILSYNFNGMRKDHRELITIETQILNHLQNIDENYSVLTK
jgi:hypothetical protein